MEQKNAREIQQALALPFAPEDLEWRLQMTTKDKTRGLAVSYVTNRAIQNRLDDVVGPDHWYNDYKPWHRFTAKVRSESDPSKFIDKEIISQLCGIAIYFEERKEWITKWDGAEDTDIEQVKGGLSDSMKRAAVQWGIGRVLYSMNTVWVDIEQRGRNFFIKDSERPKLDKAYLAMLNRLGLTPAPAGGLQSLLTPKDTAEGQPERTQATPSVPENSAENTTTGALHQQARPSAKQSPAATPPQPNPPAAPSAPDPATQAAFEYLVLGTKVQSGMSGSSTLVTLEDRNKKRIQAFARGARAELTVGTALTGVKLTVRQQDTVAFYVLESYELVYPRQSAA